ncbi:MAG TPA: acriflavine resistance protein B, partial [Alteromonas sp.]|nr:acriflavine resistance protein B [Alteromonas sp.]
MADSQRGVIAWFAQNPIAANLLMLCIIIAGVLSASELRKEAFPSMEPRFVTVSMTYDSGDAKQAEEGIAIKIENALESVPGIKRMTSTSTASGSSVQVEKETDYDLETLMTDVKNKVDAIYNFPSDAEKAVISKGRRQDHVIWVQLYGDADQASLQQLGEQLERELLAKDGISQVEASSYVDHMMSVEIDEARLQAYGLTLTDVSDAINAESSTALTTSLRNKEKVIRLKASEQAYYTGDFASIPLLADASGTYLTVGDVTNIEDMFADDAYKLSRYNGKNGYGIQVIMDEYGDVENIVEQTNELVADWHQRGLLPDGVELETWYDRSTLITERLDLLTKNAVTGIAMVFVVLAVFLNLRVAFWVAAGLPFILFGTLFCMTDRFSGLTLNEMTTFGFIMALGIVVDDAVVVGESVYSTRQKYGDSIHNTILGTLKVAVPTLFGVFTTVAAFAALSNISGGLGNLYSQFGLVVTICLLLSVVESKIILPAHLAHLPTQKKKSGGISGLWGKVQDGATKGLRWFSLVLYRPVLKYALNFRYAVILLFVALFVLVIGMPMNGTVRVGFFPSLPGDTVSAEMSLQSDASYGQNERNMQWLETSLNKADQQLMDKYHSDVSGISSLQVMASGDQSGSITVELKKDKVYSLDELASVWRELAGTPEGVKQLKIQSRREMVDAFKVELKSVSDETLLLAEEAFREALSQTDGVTSVESSLTPGEAMMRFELTPQGRAM